MLKSIAYVAAALALIALGIAGKNGVFDGVARTAQNKARLPLTEPAFSSAASAIDSPNVSADAKRLDNAGQSRLPTPFVVADHPFGLESESKNHPAATQYSVSEPQPLSSIGTEATNPDTVIGRRVPISASVEKPCRQDLAKWGKEASCGEVLQLLSEMAQQPRDVEWADTTEAQVRNIVLAESTPFTIRNIECRTSLCTAEVASTYGPFPFITRVGSDKQLNSGLLAWFADFGYESDPSGARVTVTLQMFKRR
jgi:hypothetical protein